MWLETPVFKEDMEQIVQSDFIHWKRLDRKTVFITGATGLIGYYMTNALLYRNLTRGSDIRILALVRSEEKARAMYRAQLETAEGQLQFIPGDLEAVPEIREKVDYIIHGGGPTASRFFVEHPVETIRTALSGTIEMLELGRKNHAEGMVYLSSMEVYGTNTEERKITERSPAFLDTMSARNSYPESKRMCENLCVSYFSEYKVPVNIIRLTQTFGPGVTADDQRVFAQFMRSCISGEDIVLLTEGKTRRSYLYLADAATAILAALLYDTYGEAYNAANEDTYCSIKEMAEMAAEELGGGRVQVRVQPTGEDRTKAYLPTAYTDLETKKLKQLGWRCRTELKEIFRRTAACWNER